MMTSFLICAGSLNRCSHAAPRSVVNKIPCDVEWDAEVDLFVINVFLASWFSAADE